MMSARADGKGDDTSGFPTVSVVVASRDRPASLRACLKSIRQCGCAVHEIIVVDSASRQPQATSRVATENGARFIRTDQPGAGHARSVGAASARGEVVAFTDDDAVVDSKWVWALALAFVDPTVDAAVGPVFIQGMDPPSAMPVSASIDPSTEHARFSRLDRDWFKRLRFGSIGYGANLAVRTTAFRRHGLFRACLGTGAPIPGDENYFLLCLVAHGGIVVNEPRAHVMHPPQLPERTRAFRRSTLAYLVYVLATQPRLAPQVLRQLIRRFISERHREGLPPWKPSRSLPADIADIIFAAPGLLLAAWQIERGLSKTATTPELP